MREQYDYLILGNGNGGGFLAWHMGHERPGGSRLSFSRGA